MLRLLQEKQAERKMAAAGLPSAAAASPPLSTIEVTTVQTPQSTMTRNPIESMRLDQRLVETSKKYSGKLQPSPCANQFAGSDGDIEDDGFDDNDELTIVPNARTYYGPVAELPKGTIFVPLNQQDISVLEAEDEREDDRNYNERLDDEKEDDESQYDITK